MFIMPLPNFLKKASSLILGAQSGIIAPPFNDGEVVFCKNNVCVHPPALLRQDCDVVHHPGYMTVTCQRSSTSSKLTLHLSWIPNATLRRNPWTIEKRCSQLLSCEEQIDSVNSLKNTLCDGSSLSQSIQCQKLSECTESKCACQLMCNLEKDGNDLSNGFCTNRKDHTIQCSDRCHMNKYIEEKMRILETGREHCIDLHSFQVQTDIQMQEKFDDLSLENLKETNCSEENRDTFVKTYSQVERPSSLDYSNMDHQEQSTNCEETDQEVKTPDTVHESSLNSSVSGPAISIEGSKEQVSPSPSLSSNCSLAVPLSFLGADDIPSWMSSPEMLALQHNLTFPESATASPVVRRTHRCRRFSVDLSQMRSLRLFFSDVACTCGQLVVASRESQYKILHFHHGGLDHLASVLQEWNFLLHSPQLSNDDHLPYRHFMVCRPEVSREELHPEEGLVAPVGEEMWMNLLNEDGVIEDDLTLRKSTYEEREQIIAIRRQEYHEITRRRLEMDPESKENFWRNIQCVVEKDVIRTDRGNPYFAGDDNPHVEDMKNILLSYAVYNPKFGYTQGMSDLLAPVLAEIKNESDAFWCFVGLMQKAIFVCTPTDNDMDRNLNYLRELIHLMEPDFYSHLQRHADAMELLFCHRWILLCFKREFPEPVALKMWEACWANYLTDYFHLFLCLAIVCIYSDDVIAQDLRTDEMLLHFSSLAMYMDGELILRKARGLLHQFRQMPRIPCTLGSLCQLCGPGMWDSTHAPVIECTGAHGKEPCPHRGVILQQ